MLVVIAFLFLNGCAARDDLSGMSVFVRNSQDQVYELSVTAGATVSDILRDLHIADDVAERSIISFQGKDLSPSDSLADAGICAESVLYMRTMLFLEFREFKEAYAGGFPNGFNATGRRVRVYVSVNQDITNNIAQALDTTSLNFFASKHWRPFQMNSESRMKLAVRGACAVRLVDLSANRYPKYTMNPYDDGSAIGHVPMCLELPVLYVPDSSQTAHLQVRHARGASDSGVPWVHWVAQPPKGYGFAFTGVMY